MKKKILYLILLLCAVAMPLGVRADTDYSISGNDVGGGGGGGNSTDGTKGHVVTDYVGVRVTLVNQNGNRIVGKTVNFFTKDYSDYGEGTCYTNYNNKYEISNGTTPTVYCSTLLIGGNYAGKGMTMNNIDGSYIAVDSYGIVSTLQGLKFATVANKFVELAENATNVKEFLKTYFIEYDENTAKDWYLMVEPLITYRFIGENNETVDYPYLIGTPTELTKIIYYNSYTCENEGCLNKYSGKKDWGYVYKNYIYFTKKNYGDCSKICSEFKALTPVKAGSSSDVGIVNVLGTNGYNVGLIWLGMYAKEKDTCSSVTKDYKYPSSSITLVETEKNFVVSGSGYLGYSDINSAYNPNYYINKMCYFAHSCFTETKGSSVTIKDSKANHSVSSLTAFDEWEYKSNYSGGYYKPNTGYDKNYYINSECYDAPIATTCTKEVTNASKFPLSNGGLSIATKDNYDSSKYTGYYNSGAGYDKNYYVNSVCYSAPTTTTCSSVITNSSYPPSDGNKEIKLESNYNKGNFLGYYNSGAAYDSRYYVNSNCYTRPACSDFYYNIKDFRNVPLDAAANTNCCKQYESSSGTDLNRLYRDHPECYSCTYSERRIDATCNESNNTGEVGDLLNNGIGNAQTCAYYIASGVNTQNSKTISAAKDVLTRRNDINSYCKVVCTEKVNVTFPLFNHNYIQQGSYIVWPTNLAFNDDSSKLILNGTANCWYYVDSVGLDMLSRSNKNKATEYLNECASDFKQAYEGDKKVINYDLKGNFSVNYNDPEYRKSINLVKESTEVASYSRSGSLNMEFINNATSGYRRDKLNNFVRAVEGITFEVTQTANYVIDSSSGYNYSYKGKYYNKSDDKWGNNYIELDYPSLGLKNELYKGGELKIDYSYIGGGSKKYSTTPKTYGTCEYCTVSAPIKECPAGTKNAGMNLTQIMEMESLSHEEAIAKYCGASLSVCPEDTYYAGSAVTEECLKDGVCKELTCNLHACTTEDECKVLNSCISDQIEMHGKSFEAAKLYCENAYCGYDPGKRISDSIEYRVIDLKNPFPGVSAKFGVSIFNTNVAGRKPGQNWNSLNLVKKEILNNRGVSGDKIYSLEPLFEFNLTPSVIQRIRSYNDKNPYDDFTLRCTSNQKQACVAKGFNIRSEDYGNVRTLSACQNINNLTNFNSCYNS